MSPRVSRGIQWMKWGVVTVAVLLVSKWLVMGSGGASSKDIFLTLITQGLAASLFIPLPAFLLGWMTASTTAPKPNPLGNADALFTQVAKELATGVRDEGLWVKAFALENGDDSKAKAHYIRLRVERLHQLETGQQPSNGDQSQPKGRNSLGILAAGVLVVALIGIAISVGSNLNNNKEKKLISSSSPPPSGQSGLFDDLPAAGAPNASPPPSGQVGGKQSPSLPDTQHETRRQTTSTATPTWLKIGESVASMHFISSAHYDGPNGDTTITVLSSATSDNVFNDGDLLHRSALSVFEFDCKAKKGRVLRKTLYTEQMAVGTAMPVGVRNPDWFPVSPNSLAALLYLHVCDSGRRVQ